MRLFFALAVVATSCFCLTTTPLEAQGKRVALVVGNSAYLHTPKLDNPKNDAADVAAALRKHGFTVIEGLDLDKAAMDRKVRDFAIAADASDVGLFFYAGHGLQVAGQNYLVPIDAQLTTTSALDFEMMRLDLVQRVMERGARTNILFIDACRNNPLARNLARAMGTRSTDIGRGLAAVEAGAGTLISFSTQPGNVALDGTGRNSPFAGSLTKHMAAPNDDLGSILISVRNDVMEQTARKQVPWEHSALTGRFYFAPPKAPVKDAIPPPPKEQRLLLQDDPVSELFSESDFKRIAAIAEEKQLPIRPFQIRKPAEDVPGNIRNFVGVWVSDKGYAASGRQFMLIISNVSKIGQAVGYNVIAPPNAKAYNQSPATFSAYVAHISGNKFSQATPQFETEATLTDKNQIEYVVTYKTGIVARVTLDPAWTLVEAERSDSRINVAKETPIAISPTHVNNELLRVFKGPGGTGGSALQLPSYSTVTLVKIERSWALIAQEGKALGYVPEGKLQKIATQPIPTHASTTKNTTPGSQPLARPKPTKKPPEKEVKEPGSALK